jgi:hypothetical protein
MYHDMDKCAIRYLEILLVDFVGRGCIIPCFSACVFRYLFFQLWIWCYIDNYLFAYYANLC